MDTIFNGIGVFLMRILNALEECFAYFFDKNIKIFGTSLWLIIVAFFLIGIFIKGAFGGDD